jgi:peptide/nickel transport system permease protein
MVRYVLQRLLQAAIVLVVVVTIVFVLERLSGSPVDLLVSSRATAADITAMSKYLGLEDPIYVQYGRYLLRLAQGDFGESFSYRAPVRDLIVNAFPYTAALAVAAFIFASVVGVTLGTLAAVRSGGRVDAVVRGFGFIGQSVPSFWLAIIFVMIFAVKLGWLPAFGSGGVDHLILPAVALGAFPMAAISRLTRSATLDALRADHMLFERSKGVSPSVFLSHLLRNASLPVITLSGIQLGELLSGTIIVETIFAWPGVGQLAIQALSTRDYNIVQAVVLVQTATFVLLNLLVDISYGWLDPRVRT